MSNRNSTNVGQEFRIRDCYVWSEIHYLDSATDYREYLPQNSMHARIRSIDLILLDSSRQSYRHAFPWWYFLVAFLIFGCALLYEMQ